MIFNFLQNNDSTAWDQKALSRELDALFPLENKKKMTSGACRK
jgi:hypothetical protein